MADPEAIAALQQLLQQAIAAQPPVVAQPAAPVAFARYPGLANNNVLDFNNPNDLKLFNKATEGLSSPYGLTQDSLKVFLESVKERARIYNWNEILSVADAAGINHYVPDAYGRVTMEHCVVSANGYIDAPTRNSQNNAMLYQVLSNSMTEEAKMELLSAPEVYTFGGIPSGTCFLKAIIGKASVDTIATVMTIRNAISNLDTKMSELQGNIQAFNTYVRHQKNALIARGQSTDELMLNLFKAYTSVSTQDFVMFIKNKRCAWEEGAPLTDESLMANALNKYQVMVQDGTWNAPDKRDQKIFALEAEVKELTKNAIRRPTGKPRGKRDDDSGAWAWKKDKPLNGETTKNFRKKKYHWCPHHEMWTVHEPSKCTLAQKNLPNKDDTKMEKKVPPKEENGTQSDKALSLVQALQAIVQEDDDDE
jgi:hypothetical protein